MAGMIKDRMMKSPESLHLMKEYEIQRFVGKIWRAYDLEGRLIGHLWQMGSGSTESFEYHWFESSDADYVYNFAKPKTDPNGESKWFLARLYARVNLDKTNGGKAQ